MFLVTFMILLTNRDCIEIYTAVFLYLKTFLHI